jgi:hypothetical protein
MTQPKSSVADEGAVDAAATSWVINLSASTTPMALTRPSAPELARFTFFVSRRREEGRERFRLHMGYFAARDEAEQMLEIVREVYPAAWVGEAPGRRLRSGAAGSSAAAASAAETVAPRSREATPPASAAGSPVAPPLTRPETSATPPLVAAAAAPAAAGPVAAAAPTRPSTATPPPTPAPVPPVTSPQPSSRAAGSTAPPTLPSRPAPPAARTADPAPPRAAPGASPGAPMPVEPERAVISPVVSLTPNADLTDSQVLRVLERRVDRSTDGVAADVSPEAAAGAIALLSPQDTQSWHDIRRQLEQDAAVHFAVQLEWSVSPIELARVPELAIFNAYTLYRIEGSRQGRKWYGLRLGFFKDALSAKQVAYYVRSEFAAVAVVPVSPRERGQAKDFGAIELPRTDPKLRRATRDEEITLIDDRPTRPATSAVPGAAARPAAAGTGSGAGAAATPAATGDDGSADARPAAPSGPRRAGRPRGGPPKSLEETLEILGASQLTIESARRETLLDGNARAQPDRRTTVFSKLLDRLSERLKK